MKKMIFFVAILAAVVTNNNVNAENKFKPEAMSIATEINYSFGGASTEEGFQLPEYGAKVRLFINENWAARLNLGLGLDTDTESTFSPTYDNDNETKDKASVAAFSIMPGFEYHFTKFDRISPYIGAEIGIVSLTTKSITERDYESYKITVKTPAIGFAVNAVSGVDVYLCKGLYVGAEISLGYEMLKTRLSRTTIETADGTTEETNDNTSTRSYFGFNVTPALRIGWHF